MQTDDLIKQLADDAEPVPGRTMRTRLAVVVGVGALVAVAIQVSTFGIRSDLNSAWEAVIWKLFFCLSVAVIWGLYLRSAMSPAIPARIHLRIAILLLALIALTATFAPLDLAGLQDCVGRIILLSVPALVGLIWVARQGAPIHTSAAGFAIGIVAGALGAFGYAFGCLTDEPAINALRYGAGMLATGVLSLALGQFFLRW